MSSWMKSKKKKMKKKQKESRYRYRLLLRGGGTSLTSFQRNIVNQIQEGKIKIMLAQSLQCLEDDRMVGWSHDEVSLKISEFWMKIWIESHLELLTNVAWCLMFDVEVVLNIKGVLYCTHLLILFFIESSHLSSSTMCHSTTAVALQKFRPYSFIGFHGRA